MTSVAQTEITQSSFEDFLVTRNEPEWLVDRRREAWQTFLELPMPNRGDEEWMRTDIRLFHPERFGLPVSLEDSAGITMPSPLLAAGVELGGRTVAMNSQPAISDLAEKWANKGVIFGALDELAGQHEDLLRPHLLKQAFNVKYDKFAALHAACWSGGVFLYVPPGVTIDEPLHAFSAVTPDGVDFGHTIVILDEGAQATLLAETGSDSENSGGFHCGGIELIVRKNAFLRYVNLQNWGNKFWHFAHQKGIVEADARLQWTIGALGGRLAKVNQHVALTGPGAEAQVNGVMFTEGKQHLSYHTLQHHEAPSCRSDLLYKAALQDRSRTVWRGMIKVEPSAQQTDGYQRNDNLMLSTDARADSIPGLEIEADDVRCTHGSTSGRVDEEQIFYARCRGLTRNEAIRMIVTGFFQQVFDRITVESVRQALGEAIRRRIRQYN